MNARGVNDLLHPLLASGEIYHNQTLLAIQLVMSADERLVVCQSDNPVLPEEEDVTHLALCQRLNVW